MGPRRSSNHKAGWRDEEATNGNEQQSLRKEGIPRPVPRGSHVHLTRWRKGRSKTGKAPPEEGNSKTLRNPSIVSTSFSFFSDSLPLLDLRMASALTRLLRRPAAVSSRIGFDPRFLDRFFTQFDAFVSVFSPQVDDPSSFRRRLMQSRKKKKIFLLSLTDFYLKYRSWMGEDWKIEWDELQICIYWVTLVFVILVYGAHRLSRNRCKNSFDVTLRLSLQALLVARSCRHVKRFGHQILLPGNFLYITVSSRR